MSISILAVKLGIHLILQMDKGLTSLVCYNSVNWKCSVSCEELSLRDG